jgi:phospholipid/cholesterol/gamma-HCH transport system substrate-binding protein
LKINNETKVGSLALIAVALLILGFNYLKGTSLFSESFNLYAEYQNIDGLTAGNKILINGMQVGQVNSLKYEPASGKIRVDFSIMEKVPIPEDSRAMVFSSDLLGSKAINLVLGSSSIILEDGALVKDSIAPTLAERVEKEVLPLKDRVESAIIGIDSFVAGLNRVLGDDNKDNITVSLTNLRRTTHRLDSVMNKVDVMVSSAKSIMNNFEKNNATINRIISSSAVFTDSLAAQSGKIRGIITQAESSLSNFKTILGKVDRGEGSLGLLLNDKELYNNLSSSSKSLDSLLVDVRKHPKRYVHFSVFGGKKEE